MLISNIDFVSLEVMPTLERFIALFHSSQALELSLFLSNTQILDVDWPSMSNLADCFLISLDVKQTALVLTECPRVLDCAISGAKFTQLSHHPKDSPFVQRFVKYHQDRHMRTSSATQPSLCPAFESMGQGICTTATL